MLPYVPVGEHDLNRRKEALWYMGETNIANVALAMVVAMLCVPYALGATVYGNVYDLSLEKAKGALVDVNTTPNQFMIASDGKYSFEIPRGTYLIRAKSTDNTGVLLESRLITISQEGNYVLDFILFPVIEDEEDVSIDLGDIADGGKNTALWIVLAIIGAVIAGLLAWKLRDLFWKNKETLPIKPIENDRTPATDPDLEKVIQVIAKEGGRATQKEIRQQIPFSEAKISLMITELEHKGRIEKIKKGRGNIVTLRP